MFVIIASRRSGTHLLASLLNSHPRLKCYDEIFLSRKWKLMFGRKELKKLEDKEGCIVMYRHFLRLSGKQRGLITRSKVIHLMRKNLDNHVKSYEKKSDKVNLDLRRDFRKKEIIRFRERVFNGKREFSHLFEIYYEDICGDKDIKEYKNEKLLDFLGVKPIKLTTKLVKRVYP